MARATAKARAAPAKWNRRTVRQAHALLDSALRSTRNLSAYRSGSIDNASRRDVLNALIDAAAVEFEALADRLIASYGPTVKLAMFAQRSLTDAAKGLAPTLGGKLRSLFLAGALALFGPTPLEPADLKALDAAHQVQVAYLERFADQVADGSQPPDDTLPARAALYPHSAWAAAQNLGTDRADREGATRARRILDPLADHCGPCVELAGEGWVDIEDLTPIGATPCMIRCRCSVEYRYDDDSEAEPGAVCMSKLNTKQRAALPESDFGDPSRRLFPIVDQDDVDSAAHLIGKAKNPAAVKTRIISIARRKGLKIPDAWKEGTAKMSATFSINTAGRQITDDMVIYPDSLLFRAGQYPDKKFLMSPEELWAAVEQFDTHSPLPLNLEHRPTILDGKLGEVREVRLSDDGQAMLGTVAIPKWLDDVLGDDERKVSTGWTKDKTLHHLSLVIAPRVKDAALMTAFSELHPDDPAVIAFKDATYHGQRLLQTIHDTTAGAGALCSKAKGGGATFHAAHELSTLQRIHDEAVKAGAVCGPWKKDPDDVMPMFTDRKHHPSLSEGMQRVHDVMAAYPGICGTPGGPGWSGGAPNPPIRSPATMTADADSAADGSAAPDASGWVAAFGDTTEQWKAIRQIHGISTDHGARCPVKAKTATVAKTKMSGAVLGKQSGAHSQHATQQRGRSMAKTWEDFVAFFTGSNRADDANLETEEVETPTPAPAPQPKPQAGRQAPAPAPAGGSTAEFSDPAANQKIRDLEAKLEAARQAEVKGNVVRFAEEMTQTGIVPKALQNDLTNLLTQFAEDDHANPTVVTFSAGGDAPPGTTRTGDRVAAVMALFAKLPKSHLLDQYVDGTRKIKDGFTVLFNEVAPHDPNAPPSEARKRELLGKTDIGAAVLQGQSRNGNGNGSGR